MRVVTPARRRRRHRGSLATHLRPRARPVGAARCPLLVLAVLGLHVRMRALGTTSGTVGPRLFGGLKYGRGPCFVKTLFLPLGRAGLVVGRLK
eukprot:5688988-Alexandrium_andersonii.AAC.1